MNPFDRLAALSGLCIVVGVAYFLVWLITLFDLMKSEFKKDINKFLWFINISAFPLVGIVLYFILAASQKEEEEHEDGISSRAKYRDIGRD